MPKKTLDETMSERLRRAIRESGLTHYRIAKMAECVPAVVDKFMNGLDLRMETASRIAKALGVRLVGTLSPAEAADWFEAAGRPKLADAIRRAAELDVAEPAPVEPSAAVRGAKKAKAGRRTS